VELPDSLIGRIRVAHDHEQALSGRDQTLSDRDQTMADRDQTWSDLDGRASESDQRSADEDQQAADGDFAAGGDALAYQRSASARQQSSRERVEVAASREESAAARLQTAEDRDRAAVLRDRGADGRDALARLHDQQDDVGASPEDVLSRALRDRRRAAADRAKAADDRARAVNDRQQAARDRAEARENRAECVEALKLAAADELTGGWARKFGLEEMSRELERAHRTGTAFALAFVDVDGLKQVNDSEGHQAGDALLHLVGRTLRANLRPYDVVVRYGGDELVCAMSDLGVADARARFERVSAALTAVNPDHSVSFGVVGAMATETLEDVIARADADLLEVRRANAASRASLAG
jgi:diguanylate cyclase (GGDEF)-like protein